MLNEVDLADIDKRVVAHAHSGCGLATNDTQSNMFCSKADMGYNIKTTIGTQLVSVCRELEVTLNDLPQHAIAARARFVAALQGDGSVGLSGVKDVNYVQETMAFAATYGIWVRDSRLCVFNLWMHYITEQLVMFCVGDPQNNRDLGVSLASRVHGANLKLFASGGSAYSYFLRYCERWIVANPGKHWTELVRPRNWVAEPLDKRSKRIPALCTKTKVAVALEKALVTFESDIKQIHCVYEWRRKDNDVAQCECPWDDEYGWRQLPAPEVVREHSIPFDDQDLHVWEL